MTIVVACAAFKGSLTATEACRHAAEGARRAFPHEEIVTFPVADGGTGSLDVMRHIGAHLEPITVTGPVGRPAATHFAALDPDSAFVEMADACGLLKLPGNTPAPLDSSSFGLGEAILAALDSGRPNILCGIGGSASTDGGTGMAAALGARFLDDDGRPLPPGGRELHRLSSIDLSGLDERIANARITIACDVDTPLLGADGSAAVFAPQKGATADDIELLERGLARLAQIASPLGAEPDYPGAGAAGGVGFMARLLGWDLRQGFEALSHLTGLEYSIAGANLVLTGEGRLDDQTAHGKAPMGVAELGREHGVPVWAVCGKLDLGAERVRAAGFAGAAALADIAEVEEEAFNRAGPLLAELTAALLADTARTAD
ncbi:glycerate kinase [Dietzia sp.]|uniref:glycerate kinase n=1 Tax=Dietzia sp. TaxID=1871616 RepID=UPI002FD950C8